MSNNVSELNSEGMHFLQRSQLGNPSKDRKQLESTYNSSEGKNCECIAINYKKKTKRTKYYIHKPNNVWHLTESGRESSYHTFLQAKLCSSITTTTTALTTTATISNCKRNFSKTVPQWLFVLWHLLSIVAIAWPLSMTEVRIPKHIMRFEDAILSCKYDLDGEALYSVKWYKDNLEFYRYVPRDKPPGQVFPLPGVNVNLQNSSDNIVVIEQVTLQSSGRYRCEVSGEAPSFQTVYGHEDMIVVVTPTRGPHISGGQPRYQIGDTVRVNCTSAPSKPVCHLSWLINGMHANRSFLRYYDSKIVEGEDLQIATLGLEFRCIAKISSIYWQSNEESVESDKHQRIPVLESRETVISKSHLLEEKPAKISTSSSTCSRVCGSDMRWYNILIIFVKLASSLKVFTTS